MNLIKTRTAGSIAIIVLLFLLIGMVEWTLDKYVYTQGSVYRNLHNYIVMVQEQPEYVPLPYQNYINNPGLNEPDRRLNNNAGLRLNYEVDLNKPDSVYRILFLGGSTTYGCLVHDTDSYVSRLSGLLNAQLPALKTRYNKVECLNGGMGGATSAEILTHYLMKYQYMHPDLVVVNAGINDCGAYGDFEGAVYQPDYRHWRKSVQEIPKIPAWLKQLMVSKIISLAVLKTIYGYFFKMKLTDNELQHFNDKYQWFGFGRDSMLVPRYNAFYNNLFNLGLVAGHHNQQLMLVTEVIDTLTMPKEFVTLYHTSLLQNNRMLDSLAHQLPCYLLKLDNTEFTSKEFVDDDLDGIHLNPDGERLKALKMAPAVVDLITE